MELYERIKQRREELKMSQQDLAEKLGYKSRSSINKIELGKNDIYESKIVEFAKALQTTPSFLMGWTNEVKKITPPSIEDEIISEFSKLSDTEKNQVANFVKFLNEERK